MKTRPMLAAVALALAATNGVAHAGTKDYIAICQSSLMSKPDRVACREQMKAADSDAARSAVFRAFDLKMSGFGPDGKRLSTAADETKSTQDAAVVGK